MTIGALDLSIVTARVIDELNLAKAQPQIWADPADKFDIDFSGEHPHAPRKEETCRVSLYLFHVNPDPAHRNTYPLNGRARTVPEHPLGLTLHYLLSAQGDSFAQEQHAMSVALKCIHEHPFMTAAVPRQTHVERFTLTLEPQSSDEIGRLWLAMATPLQLSAVLRAEVVFLAPEDLKRPAVAPVRVPNVTAYGLSSPPLASPPTSSGVAIVTGAGFDEATIALRIQGQSLTIVSAPPLAPGQALVINPAELQLRLPAGTPRGDHVLRVRFAPGWPVEEVVLRVTRDVP